MHMPEPKPTSQGDVAGGAVDDGDDDILYSRDDLLICETCGTQFGTADRSLVTSCLICDDPRQYVPPTGQTFTTLRHVRRTHTTHLNPHPSSPTLYTLSTTPKLGIGQRAFLVRTPGGNILWDSLTLLDPPTVAALRALGGLAAIVISHPHFYTSHLLWAAVFACPVYLAADDRRWLVCPDNPASPARVFIDRPLLPIPGARGASTGATAIKLGGHFPGSLVLQVGERLLTADTLMVTPAGVGDWGARGRPRGMNSFVFMYSYPNMIPLAPPALATLWRALAPHEFTATHGAFPGTDLEAPDVKPRVWESVLLQVRSEGHDAERFVEEYALCAPAGVVTSAEERKEPPTSRCALPPPEI